MASRPPRRSARLLKKKQASSSKATELPEPRNPESQGDSTGIRSIVSEALQNMTQLVTALQAAVQENPTPLRAKAVQKPKVPARQTLKRRSTTRSPQPESQTSDKDTDSSSDDADDESEDASVATNQDFRSRS